MARMVVLYFEDNEDAERAVQGARQEQIAYGEDEGTIRGAEVIGVFGLPTKYCECEKTRNYPIGVGQKFGWRIHIPCGLAARQYQVAKNLIPKEERPPQMYAGVISFSNYINDRFTPQPAMTSLKGNTEHLL